MTKGTGTEGVGTEGVGTEEVWIERVWTEGVGKGTEGELCRLQPKESICVL